MRDRKAARSATQARDSILEKFRRIMPEDIARDVATQWESLEHSAHELGRMCEERGIRLAELEAKLSSIALIASQPGVVSRVEIDESAIEDFGSESYKTAKHEDEERAWDRLVAQGWIQPDTEDHYGKAVPVTCIALLKCTLNDVRAIRDAFNHRIRVLEDAIEYPGDDPA